MVLNEILTELTELYSSIQRSSITTIIDDPISKYCLGTPTSHGFK